MNASGRSADTDDGSDMADVFALGDVLTSDVRDLLRVVRDCRLILGAILLMMLLGVAFGVFAVVSAGQVLS